MTDKQIIIDRVDGSKCENFNSNHDRIDSAYHLFDMTTRYVKCENRKDCYFKQLTCKTQECEVFKDKIKYMEEYIKTVENARDELERENKFLKEENAEIIKYQYEQDFLQQQLDQLKIAKEQAEQKLEKIKDRCNETLELMNKDSGTNAYAGGRCIEAGQILHIIDEVE